MRSCQKPCWCGYREDVGEENSVKTFVAHSHASLCLWLSPSLCNYYSHNEKWWLECQYLQGTLAAVAEKSCTGVGTTVNNEEKKSFKFIKRRNKRSCSHCWALACYAMLSHFSRVRLCATPWIAAYQAPPFMGFSRQKYWSGVPLPSPHISREINTASGAVWYLSDFKAGVLKQWRCQGSEKERRFVSAWGTLTVCLTHI